MQPKTSLKERLFIISGAGIVLSAVIIFFLTLLQPAQGFYLALTSIVGSELVGLKAAPEQVVAAGLPIRLKIPSIRINAVVEYVGLTSNGSMGIPKMPRNAAWFKLGARPGEIGSAAIAGHINWWNGATAVFANLHKLKVGDKITVQDDKGKIISFTVQRTRLYGAKEDAPEVFSANDDLAHLNLITCGGVWNKRTQQYSKRLVVFAVRDEDVNQ